MIYPKTLTKMKKLNKFLNTPFGIVIFTCIFTIIMQEMINVFILKDTHKQGQIDAINGKWKYEKVITIKKEVSYKRISE